MTPNYNRGDNSGGGGGGGGGMIDSNNGVNNLMINIGKNNQMTPNSHNGNNHNNYNMYNSNSNRNSYINGNNNGNSQDIDNDGNNGYGLRYDENYQYQQPISNNGDYLSPDLNENIHFIENTSQPGSFNETFLDDFDSIGLPPKSIPQYNLNLQQNIPPTSTTSNQTFSNFFNPTNNLDDLISPKNNQHQFDDNQFNQTNSFTNPQYFSPKNNSHFHNLNSIAEDNILSSSLTINESLSGTGSYNDHVGADILAGNHLSPAQVLPYVSPNNYENTYDTLRSPLIQAENYMNSPPQFPSLRNNLPPPIKQESMPNTNIIFSPKNTNLNQPSLSSSLNSSNLQSRDSTSTKQLTKEEKLKRRRDFHNQVERRRRDLIKEKIKTLGQIVPPSLLNPPLCAVQNLQAKASTNSLEINDLISSVKVKETKPNKSTILNKSVEYIKHLVYVIEKQEAAKSKLLKQIEECQKPISSSIPSNRLAGVDSGSLLDDNNNQHDTNFDPDEFFLEISDQKDFYN